MTMSRSSSPTSSSSSSLAVTATVVVATLALALALAAPANAEGNCTAGLEWSSTQQLCVDINDCLPHPCFVSSTCFDEPAPARGYTCAPCPPGYEGDGVHCVDINGCKDAPCYPNVECVDLPPPSDGFECGQCPVGLSGDGLNCTVYHDEQLWTEVEKNLCFGASDDSSAAFQFRMFGVVAEFRLVHRSGAFVCDKSQPDVKSNWGCAPDTDLFGVFIADEDSRRLVVPEADQAGYVFSGVRNQWYSLATPGITSSSAELTMTVPNGGVEVTSDTSYALFYGEDLFAHGTSNNDGIVCVDLMARYLSVTSVWEDNLTTDDDNNL
eukprot:TRINITY_DN105720_c0_g1_i1.p1 TRINITY_DN105720_c0_g1~~TRINITY_DN105720_c0_g1_i1.p1  ORF type:complete len:332 (-),score=151.65 TRINITY_DN105720_c0_g1_i1:201-1172(-)